MPTSCTSRGHEHCRVCLGGSLAWSCSSCFSCRCLPTLASNPVLGCIEYFSRPLGSVLPVALTRTLPAAALMGLPGTAGKTLRFHRGSGVTSSGNTSAYVTEALGRPWCTERSDFKCGSSHGTCVCELPGGGLGFFPLHHTCLVAQHIRSSVHVSALSLPLWQERVDEGMNSC